MKGRSYSHSTKKQKQTGSRTHEKLYVGSSIPGDERPSNAGRQTSLVRILFLTHCLNQSLNYYFRGNLNWLWSVLHKMKDCLSLCAAHLLCPVLPWHELSSPAFQCAPGLILWLLQGRTSFAWLPGCIYKTKMFPYIFLLKLLNIIFFFYVNIVPISLTS